MSAIGGIADLGRGGVEFCALDKMRIAMGMRGRERSAAYLGENVYMLCNSASQAAFDSDFELLPAIFERGGHIYVLCIDSDELCASVIFERYRTEGVDFLGRLDAPFALALYDGERKMLLLARDRRGAKPLFYKTVCDAVYFASEIKGIYASLGGKTVISREMLSLHLSAPFGVYHATDIFTELCEVLAGECVIFTELGCSRFRYRDRSAHPSRQKLKQKQEILVPYPLADTCALDDALREALIAFDYPQFDAAIPSLCRLFDGSRRHGRYNVVFEDAIRAKSPSYAYERQDRLGGFFGVSARGVLPRADAEAQIYASDEMHDALLERVMSLKNDQNLLLRSIFGSKKQEYLMRRLYEKTKNKDTEDRIRILGMILQTVMWAESRELVIKSTCDDSIQSALSMM